MATLTPQGDKLRSLRTSLGWTQLELAVRAGVSDRTVRNAENSQPLRRQFLEYIAGALGVTLAEISVASHELAQHLAWQKNCDRFIAGIHRALVERDPRELAQYAHDKLEMHVHSQLPTVDSMSVFLGDYKGNDELQRFVERVEHFWELDVSGVVTVEQPFGAGNTIVVRGIHELLDRDGNVVWGQYNYIADFEGERIRAVEGMIRPGTPPPGVTGILTPRNGFHSTDGADNGHSAEGPS